MHSDWVSDHGESDKKLKSLEKHIQEVHRSVQILIDKQELTDDTQEFLHKRIPAYLVVINNRARRDLQQPLLNPKMARTHQIFTTGSWHLHYLTKSLHSSLSINSLRSNNRLQHNNSSRRGTAQSGEGYMPGRPLPQFPPGNTYMVIENESGRTHHLPPQPQFQQGGYPPQQNHPPRIPSTNTMGPPPQPMRANPYNELIKKLVNMGYRGEHVLGVIQRLEESGQPIDFNAVLERLFGFSERVVKPSEALEFSL